MPGLFGIAARGLDPTLDHAFERLSGFESAPRALHRERSVDVGGRWALGRAHHGVLQPAPQLERATDVRVLFHGDLQNRRDLARGASPAIGPGASAADVVRSLYRSGGAAFASRLRGSYCAAVLDDKSRTLTLVSDQLGSYPLYWTATDHGLVFASELRAILRSGIAPRALNPAAVADVLTYGFLLGTKTLARGVQLLPPGCVLTYGLDSGDVSVSQYANVADRFEPWNGSQDAFYDALTTEFRGAMERAFDGDHAFGLALSGGLDSRALLSSMNGRASALTTYTLGVDGCADQVIAQRLSSIAGTKHLFFEMNRQYLADFIPNLERMVWLTDGMYVSHGLTEVLALQFLATSGIRVLLRGHGGELAKTDTAWPFHTDARIRAMPHRSEVVPYLLGRMNYLSADINLRDVFTPDWGHDVADRARASLETSVRDVDLSPSDLCTYLYLTEHHRRSSVPSLELFRDGVEIRTPFFDPDFMGLLLRAPAPWREGVEIHRVLTNRGNPQLLRVRNSNTGAPGDAGPLVEAALDKVNTALRRLNVYGYRHYHQFDAWMRAELLKHVELVLLDRRALDRGVYREDGVQTLIDETRSGTADRSFLLLALLIVEIWQRQNL